MEQKKYHQKNIAGINYLQKHIITILTNFIITAR